jgi:Zn-dependent peptidase ImmA (M78 family)
LAQELGHIILHKDIYSKVAINSLSEWKKFISEANEDDYNQLEFQANCFAGLFLVPQPQLGKTFDVALKKQLMNVEKSKNKVISREEYLPWVIDRISMELARIFEVDQQVIKIRIEREKLFSKIP